MTREEYHAAVVASLARQLGCTLNEVGDLDEMRTDAVSG